MSARNTSNRNRSAETSSADEDIKVETAKIAIASKGGCPRPWLALAAVVPSPAHEASLAREVDGPLSTISVQNPRWHRDHQGAQCVHSIMLLHAIVTLSHCADLHAVRHQLAVGIRGLPSAFCRFEIATRAYCIGH